MTVATTAGFGEEHFGTAELGDARRTKRLVRAADRVAAHPAGTLPAKMGTAADLKGLYRLLDAGAVTHAAVLGPHRRRTLGLMRECGGVVLLVHDATQLDYTGKGSLAGQLGQVAKGRHRGYVCQNTLAVEAATGAVIGLASQVLHRRPRAAKGERLAARRARPDRETRLWTRGSEAVGPPPAGRLWVDVCDRGADLFEYLDHKRDQGGSYVVRSKHDRVVWPGGDRAAAAKLHAHARSLPTLGTWSVDVAANAGRPAARPGVRVRVAAGPVTPPVPRPAAGDHGDRPLDAWVVLVREVGTPPPGVPPLEWVLLTNVPTGGFAAAEERAGWYARRPVIEEYHKAQKTGCGIELPQLTDVARLEPVIALLSVVAVSLLALRDAARDPASAARPATDVVPEPCVRMLNAWRWGDAGRRTTAAEFLLAVARLGGHLNRKADGPPGWLTIWRGWQDLMVMVRAADALDRSG